MKLYLYSKVVVFYTFAKCYGGKEHTEQTIKEKANIKHKEYRQTYTHIYANR